MWRRRLVGAAALGLLGLGLLCAGIGGSIACGTVPARVRGVVVDARTGGPVEGAAILTLQAIVPEEDLATWWQIARHAAEARARGHLGFVSPGSAHTNVAGAFETVVALTTSYRTNWLGVVSDRTRENASNEARYLRVEREGYEPLFHDTKDARWMERADGKIVGTLEVGTIRLEPVRK